MNQTDIDTPAARAVVIHPDPAALYQATAARLLLALLDAQSVRRPVHVAIAGGSVGSGVLAAATSSPLRDIVDFTGVHLWWVDERFVEAGSADRNDQQAAQFCAEVGLEAAQVHAMPSSDSIGDIDAAAHWYSGQMARFAESGQPLVFDIILLGMGPDGHVASLFPGHSTLAATTPVVVEQDSPKPPPRRLSLTFPVLNAARQVWLVVAGPEKAYPVTQALQGGSLPAARVGGHELTLWLLDAAAAGQPSTANRASGRN
ncbi:MAG: 6-phosphogluconolactonase [Beutenbergiaceae bacterium]